MVRRLCALLALASVSWQMTSCNGEEELSPAPLPETVAQSIVNGVNESGFPAVGALVYHLRSGQTYKGSFCSGTLIRKNWVLTAAHCLDEPAYPDDIAFLVGEHAETNEATGAVPSGSRVYRAQRTIIHPLYESDVKVYDIGLVQLKENVRGVDPMPLFAGDLNAYEGTSTKSVGYGATAYDSEANDSRRRSTDLTLMAAFDGEYYVQGSGTGICYGDSGGANLIHVGNAWQLAGVHSRGWPADDGDECLGPTVMTSVEAYRSWILQNMGESADCNRDPSLCHCDEACQPDGQCALYSCDTRATCGELLYFDGDMDAYLRLRLSMTPESLRRYEQLLDCYYDGGLDWEACKNEYLSCMADGLPQGEGENNCVSTTDCLLNAYQDEDRIAQCLINAKGEASLRANSLYYCAAFYDCWISTPVVLSVPSNSCMMDACEEEWIVCNAYCGNGVCESSETAQSCPTDCEEDVGGDMSCAESFDCLWLSDYCDYCEAGYQFLGYESLEACRAALCKTCSPSEEAYDLLFDVIDCYNDSDCMDLDCALANCPDEMNACFPPGDGICSVFESLETHPEDCHVCGDGLCTVPYEDPESCLQDCPMEMPANDTCETAIQMDAEGGRYESNTSFANDNYRGRRSPDVFYRFTLSGPGKVTLTTGGEGLSDEIEDTVLWLLDGSCNAFDVIAWNDDIDIRNRNYYSSLTETLEAGDYYVVVEGYDADVKGRFYLDYRVECVGGASCIVCPDGYYGSPCVPCSAIDHCEAGAVTCINARDSVCSSCDAGYYGDRCTRCPSIAHCTSGGVTCSSARDAVCASCEKGYYGEQCTACPSADSCVPGHVTCTNASDWTCDLCEEGYLIGSGHCDVCAEGYFNLYDEMDHSTGGITFYETPLCERCEPVAHCKGQVTCTLRDNAVCSACEEGYRGSKCDACDDGYYASNAPGSPLICTPCGNPIAHCEQIASCTSATDAICARCENGYYGEQCTACDEVPHCEASHTHCTHTGDVSCDLCEEGYILEGGRCDSCAAGYYPATDEDGHQGGGTTDGEGIRCERCTPVAHCSGEVTCSSDRDSVCSQCDEGYRGSQCDRCAIWYYPSNAPGEPLSCNACSPAPVHCEVISPCSDASDTECVRCEPGYYGERCDACNPVAHCKPGAVTCTDGGDSICTSCDEGYFGEHCDPVAEIEHCIEHRLQIEPIFEAICVRCEPGYYGERCDACKPVDYCRSGAVTCNNAEDSICTSCESGYYGERCDPCTPIAHCHEEALNCTQAGRSFCQLCTDGFAGEQCESCADGHYQRMLDEERFECVTDCGEGYRADDVARVCVPFESLPEDCALDDPECNRDADPQDAVPANDGGPRDGSPAEDAKPASDKDAEDSQSTSFVIENGCIQTPGRSSGSWLALLSLPLLCLRRKRRA